MTTLEVKPKTEKKTAKSQAAKTYATGRRKNAVARVWVQPGSGKVTVNKLDVEQYFKRSSHKTLMLEAFEATKTSGQFDVVCTSKGGGLSGQAGAIRLGIARALQSLDEALRAPLKAAGLLTRDARVVERKKYGKRKARKSTQFSKR